MTTILGQFVEILIGINFTSYSAMALYFYKSQHKSTALSKSADSADTCPPGISAIVN